MPVFYRIAFGATIACVCAFVGAGTGHAQSAPPLTLLDALARAAGIDPGVQAASAGVEAAEGARRQASARLNPELSADVENFSGSDDLRGFQGAETTFSVSQEIERGGRRAARVALADREIDLAQSDRAVRRLDLLRDVEVAYFEAIAADEMAAIARERLSTAEALQQSVARRVAAARDPLMAGARAAAGLADARLELERAVRAARSARARLASYWSGDAEFSLSPAALDAPQTLALDPAPAAAPDVVRLAVERERADAALRLERAQAYQSPTLSLGYRRFEESDDSALVAGVSIPLGVFDRNRGAIQRAQAERRRAAFELEAGRQAFAREFATLQIGLENDSATVHALETEVIPEAERALALAREGYDRGAFSYLDVLEAQRALSDARQRRIEALRAYHTNMAALNRLTARYAEPFPNEAPGP